MDLAIYINELLGLKGEVNVPGIGFFQQKRISGYYNENERKFYPPHHDIVFDPQAKDDDGLAVYISDKKNISPASAKYFIDKYATGLKTQAAEQKVDITGLGHLFYEYSTLNFKSDKAYTNNDPSFYGLLPVKMDKNAARTIRAEQPAVKPEPVVQNVIPTPMTVEEAPVDTEQEEQPVYTDTRSFIPRETLEETENPHRNRTWVIVLLLVIVALLCFGVAYQYKPEWFGKKSPIDTTVIIKAPAPAKKIDTAKANAKKDTTSPTVAPVSTVKAQIDTYAVVRYEILAGAFPSLEIATAQMEKYKKRGLSPRLLTHAPGRLKKITLGTYFDRTEADNAADSIMTANKFTDKDIYVQPYNPIKK